MYLYSSLSREEDLVPHESLFPAFHLVEVLPVGAVNADHLVLGLAPRRVPLLLEILLLREDPNLITNLNIWVFPLLHAIHLQLRFHLEDVLGFFA